MKKFVFSVVILLASLSYAVAQPYFDDMYIYINEFMEDATKEAVAPKRAKHKIIDFSKKGYIIEGLLHKDTLVQNQVMTIKSNDGNIILYGRYSSVNGKNTITGRHQYKIGDKTVSAYGTFVFSNAPDGQLVLKRRKAKELSVEDNVDIVAYSGYYQSYPAILCKFHGRNGVRYYWLHIAGDAFGVKEFAVKVPQKDILEKGYEDIYSLLCSDFEEAMILYRTDEFKGRVKCADAMGSGCVSFTPLEGKKRYFNGKVVSISKIGSQYAMNVTKPRDDKSVSERTFFLPDNFVVELDSLWNMDYFMGNSEKIQVKYNNGDRYAGDFCLNKDTVSMTEGLYAYKNGDKFVGDMVAEKNYGIPVAGKTIFNDGTVKYGNWIDEYGFDENQLNAIISSVRQHIPSEVKIRLDKKKQYDYQIDAAANDIDKGDYYSAQSRYNVAANNIVLPEHKYKLNELQRQLNLKITARQRAIEAENRRKKIQSIVNKYGCSHGLAAAMYNNEIRVGMTKEMVKDMLGKDIDFYRISTWNDWGDKVEAWEYDYYYGINKRQMRTFDEGVKNNNVKEAYVSAVLIGELGKNLGGIMSMATEYKYFKFTNSVLVELRDSSDYDDMNNAFDNLLYMLENY